MGYDRRSPFSVSDTWSSSPNYGPTSHDQPWVVVDTDGSYNTAAAPAQFTLMGQMTVIGTSGERCSFQSASNALTENSLAGQKFDSPAETFNASSDESINVQTAGGFFRGYPQRGTTFEASTHSRLTLFAFK